MILGIWEVGRLRRPALCWPDMQRLRPSSRGQQELGVRAPVPRELKEVGPRSVQALLRWQTGPLLVARARRRVQVGVLAHALPGRAGPRRGNQVGVTAHRCDIGSGIGWLCWHSPGMPFRRRHTPLADDKYTPMHGLQGVGRVSRMCDGSCTGHSYAG